MVAHKAAFYAREVERLVILVVVILGAEMLIPAAGHILLEESYKVFEEFEAILSQFIAELATGDDDTPVGAPVYLHPRSISISPRKISIIRCKTFISRCRKCR